MFAVWIDTGHPRKLEGNLSILFFPFFKTQFPLLADSWDGSWYSYWPIFLALAGSHFTMFIYFQE